MRFLYGWAVLTTIMVLAVGATAESGYTTLVGTWKRFGSGCTPCILEIEQIKNDGEVVAKYFGLNSWVEGWGRASMKHEKIEVNITLAGGGRLDLRLNKKGNELEGFAVPYSEPGAVGTGSFKRVVK